MTVEQFTVDEITKILKISRNTVIRLIEAGEIRAARIGRAYRISKADLQAYYRASGGGELFESVGDQRNG